MIIQCQICKRIQTYGVLYTPFLFYKKFALTSVGIRKLEMEGCVDGYV